MIKVTSKRSKGEPKHQGNEVFYQSSYPSSRRPSTTRRSTHSTRMFLGSRAISIPIPSHNSFSFLSSHSFVGWCLVCVQTESEYRGCNFPGISSNTGSEGCSWYCDRIFRILNLIWTINFWSTRVRASTHNYILTHHQLPHQEPKTEPKTKWTTSLLTRHLVMLECQV